MAFDQHEAARVVVRQVHKSLRSQPFSAQAQERVVSGHQDGMTGKLTRLMTNEGFGETRLPPTTTTPHGAPPTAGCGPTHERRTPC